MKVTAEQLKAFARDLSDAFDSDELLTVDQCLLQAASRQSGNRYFQDVILSVREQVVSGIPVSEAMAKHPDAFNRGFVTLARKGETTGSLNVVMKQFGEAPTA